MVSIHRILSIAMTKIKKILFCDVDGVLLDFTGYTLPYLSAAYGVKIPDGYIPSTWNMTDLAPKGTDVVSWESIVPDDWCLHLNPFPKAKVFLNKMRKKGYHIVMVTRIGQTRQLQRLENLIKHGLYFDEIYFTAHGQSKSGVISTVLKRHKPNKWSFVDDKALTCSEVLELNKKNSKVYSLDYPFNESVKKQNPKGLVWLNSEAELYEKVLKDG